MNKQNMDSLLNAASKHLNSTPEELRKTLESGNIKALSNALSKEDKEKLRAVLANKELMEKLKSASNPQDVMRILNNK
ncbi:MAG: hypothetical protein ACI4QY_03450 [Oscillospiraceae bacterium]